MNSVGELRGIVFNSEMEGSTDGAPSSVFDSNEVSSVCWKVRGFVWLDYMEISAGRVVSK